MITSLLSDCERIHGSEDNHKCGDEQNNRRCEICSNDCEFMLTRCCSISMIFVYHLRTIRQRETSACSKLKIKYLVASDPFSMLRCFAPFAVTSPLRARMASLLLLLSFQPFTDNHLFQRTITLSSYEKLFTHSGEKSDSIIVQQRLNIFSDEVKLKVHY